MELTQEQTRSIESYLEEIESIEEPDFDPSRKNQPDYEVYKEQYKKEQRNRYRQKANLILEACRLHRDDDCVPELMNMRWRLLGWNQPPPEIYAEILKDIETILLTNNNKKVTQHAVYWRAYYQLCLNDKDKNKTLKFVRHFVDTYPDDDRGAQLLPMVANDNSLDTEVRISFWQRMAKAYPDSHWGKYAPGVIRQIKSIGKPFELTFNDVVTGKTISLKNLRGKVVVVDFWATTCGPCIAELPHMKDLYTKYHNKGLEIIGVSLDEPKEAGGLKALHTFMTKTDIPWPQYYQGNGYDSDFSKSWGIGSAPKLFVIDKAGKLYSTDARGKLDKIIPKLLEQD